jgi:gamma-glutamylcysteine synthetase
VYTENFARTVKEGRRPGLTLHNGEAEVPLPVWGAELLERIRPVAALLDALRGGTAHADALAAQAAKLTDPELTPSAKVLAALRANGKSFGAFALAQSEQHAAYFRSHPPSAEEAAYFDNLAACRWPNRPRWKRRRKSTSTTSSPPTAPATCASRARTVTDAHLLQRTARAAPRPPRILSWRAGALL